MSRSKRILQGIVIATGLLSVTLPSLSFANGYGQQSYYRSPYHGHSQVTLQRASFTQPRWQQPRQAQPIQDVWQRVFRGYRFGNYGNNALVRKFVAKYTRNPSYINTLLQRAQPYLHVIMEEIDRRGLPSELALLPLVESAFKPHARSRVGAAGLWQFMPATGKSYGLIQGRGFDARLDTFASTGAALSYLQTLSQEFRGDWFLALASYNAGPNRVKRSQARHGYRKGYWGLSSLPRETREYVPRLLAFKEIISNPHRYGVRLPAIPNRPVLTQVRLNKAVDLRLAARLAGLPSDTLTSLNPYFRTGVTTPHYSNRIILPRFAAPQLIQVLNRMPAAYRS